jgi:microcystin-dependent protein
MHTTTRLGLQTPDGSDTVTSFTGGPAAQVNSVLDRAAIWITPTTASSRPAAGSVVDGSFHRSTDTNVVSVSDGTNWHSVLTDSVGPPIGAITDHLGATDPVDVDGIVRWLILNGRSLLRATYPVLFSVIGTAYGSVDGTHFTLPNLGGRTTIAAGAGALAVAKNVGDTGGEEKHTLTTAELASHTHDFYIGTVGSVGGPWVTVRGSSNDTPSVVEQVTYPGQGVQPTGSNTPHNNLQPYFTTNKIVRAL